MTHVPSPGDSLLSSLWLSRSKAVSALFIGSLGAILAIFLGSPERAPWSLVLALSLSWAAAVDLDRFILPDILTLGLVMCGLAHALTHGLVAAQPNLIGAVLGYLALAIVAEVYKKLRNRAGLGMGDAKLLAAAGAWLGWTFLPFVLLLASASCLAVVGAQAVVRRSALTAGPVPFGPYIALAIWGLWLVQIGSLS